MADDDATRVVSIQPDKFLGLLGDHEEFPVESIKARREEGKGGLVLAETRRCDTNVFALACRRALVSSSLHEELAHRRSQDLRKKVST